jgi:hypothetical protein
MKRIPLLLAVLAIPTMLFGQGQVIFFNFAATPIRTNSSSGGGNISGVNAYRIGLYTAPAGTVNESLFTLTVLATNSSIISGRIGGGGLVDIPGNTGTPIAYQVRAWSLWAGNSYESALVHNSYVGQSAIGGITPTVNGVPPRTLFTATAGVPEFPGQLASGFTLYPVMPEPATYALMILGALAFCCGRYKAR